MGRVDSLSTSRLTLRTGAANLLCLSRHEISGVMGKRFGVHYMNTWEMTSPNWVSEAILLNTKYSLLTSLLAHLEAIFEFYTLENVQDNIFVVFTHEK